MKETKALPNVIFLDIDGPLCAPRACLATGNTSQYSYLDPIACLLVKKLCDECNAKIVVSSAWREVFGKEAMEAILSANCPRLGEYVWQSNVWWRTPTFAVRYSQHDTNRGREIKNWLDANSNKFNNFCVIDDMSDMRPVQSSLVKCDAYDGMGWHQYRMAEKMLLAPAE